MKLRAFEESEKSCTTQDWGESIMKMRDRHENPMVVNQDFCSMTAEARIPPPPKKGRDYNRENSWRYPEAAKKASNNDTYEGEGNCILSEC